MFRLYRPVTKGEFFVVFGDTAQGGPDSNFLQFLSKTQVDIPLVMQKRGTIAACLPYIVQALEYVYKQTGVPPCVALERNNGGASAMHNLIVSNLQNHWSIYYMRDVKGQKIEDKPGWDTNGVTRPKMLGEWEVAFNTHSVQIYDKPTIEQHKTFIVNKNNRPEAAKGMHDDAVISCAGAWQMYQSERPLIKKLSTRPRARRAKFHVGGRR